MADLLKRNYKWNTVPESANDYDDVDDDGDDNYNDDDKNNANQQDAENFTLSLIQEVCSEEPVHVTSDIQQIVARGLFENEVKDILEKAKIIAIQKNTIYNNSCVCFY